jgi:hypothetical protein
MNVEKMRDQAWLEAASKIKPVFYKKIKTKVGKKVTVFRPVMMTSTQEKSFN